MPNDLAKMKCLLLKCYCSQAEGLSHSNICIDEAATVILSESDEGFIVSDRLCRLFQ